jgi:hypothetical protein
MPYQGRLPASGQSHDAENLATLNSEAGVRNAQDGLKAVCDGSLIEILLPRRLNSLSGTRAKDLPHATTFDGNVIDRVFRVGLNQY